MEIVLLTGIKEEALVQCLIFLDVDAALHAFGTRCRSYEAARTIASSVYPSLVRCLFTADFRPHILPASLVTVSVILQSALLLTVLWAQGSLAQDSQVQLDSKKKD